ncbi:MAG: beta-L-arabinofuranosidase domain-containing protein, partial [Armatimonadota bacterium]
ENNAWLDPNGRGEHGWEEVPYWLKGLTALGYVLGDKRIIDESRRWIDGILSSQRPDGYFGPQSNRDHMDLWPNMCALYALRTFYEATGDKRVLPFMTRYFKWQTTVPFEQLLPGSWQKVRGGDNLDSIYWLYNRTGEKWLLEGARVNHERTADWTAGIASWHGVNFGQCFREPGQFYQQTGDIRYLKAVERNYDTMFGIYGQVPGGGFGADENAREGYTGPRQGTETCTWAELMWSHEMLASITGDIKWLDRCEEVAFNSLPASMTPDLKGLHYLTCPNQVQLDQADKSPMIQNGGNMFAYDPYGFRCCQHNVGFAWPYFTEHLWMATTDKGLAAAMYAPCSVSAQVGDGTVVKITETTDYPFKNVVSFRISTPKPVRFPLCLRIPGWCERPGLSLNGKTLKGGGPAGKWMLIDRTWTDGDSLELVLPMDLKVRRWENNRNTASIYRGPLIYSLKIGERWQRCGFSENWPAYEVFPTTPWNYGLVLDPHEPE